MKTAHKCLTSIACFAMLALLASCAGMSWYTANDSTAGEMTEVDAKVAVLLEYKRSHSDVTDVRFSSDHVIAVLANGTVTPLIHNLSKITSLSTEGNELIISVAERDSKYTVFLSGSGLGSVSRSKQFMNAIFALSRFARQREKAYAGFVEEFEKSLPVYLAKIASNVELPEEARKYKVQAEGAVRAKDFSTASGNFMNAISLAPWSPSLYFNRALVSGELGEYKLATIYMKCYLKLAPEAPNARAAQDKIYEWERADTI